MKIGEYVNRKGTLSPTGTIEAIKGDIATVYWGTADNNRFEEKIPLEDLQIVPYEIVPPEEVIKRQKEISQDTSKYDSLKFRSTRKT